ncbi:MAG: BatA domain-containing protein [Bacteroidota bacterium]
MQFIHPELLWGLFALSIPVIIHLFQLRKFRKEAFTNVALLERIEIQTRKSARLKKWLIFSIRILAATAIIIAFAQPYYTRNKVAIPKSEPVIYLDNSFSMQAKGSNGALLKQAVHDLIAHLPEETRFTLFTNDRHFKNTTIKALKDELLALAYAAEDITINDAILKANATSVAEKNTAKEFILLSDFQQHNTPIHIPEDSLTTLRAVKLNPQSIGNSAIDSLYISEKTPNGYKLTASLSRQDSNTLDTPVSLYNNDTLIIKASATFEENVDKTEISFDIPSEEMIKGKITVEDESGLAFDDMLYFTINPKEKINVLSINEADATFLERIYTDEEFVLTSVPLDALDYNSIFNQNVIVLNELNTIPNALHTSLKSFRDKGGSIVVIASEELAYPSYNQLLKTLNFGVLTDRITQEKKIITIAYSHPVFKNVFEKQVQNFQYPDVKRFYTFKGNASSVLQLENNAPFLAEKNNTYLFTAPLNQGNSNFRNSPLIVPIFYNIGKNSMQLPQLYYTIGNQNPIDVKTKLEKDNILTLSNAETAFIPQQQAFDNKVQLITREQPSKAGTYALRSDETTISHLSFNYSRNENILKYHTIDTLKHISTYTSFPQLFTGIKNENNTTALWKWFVIFALALLTIEVLLLKLFR